MDTLDGKLLRRSLSQKRTHQSIKPLYGDQSWVNDLDIVNELGGHSGCVNALSWSTSGRFLASGSDDTYLNIWEYNPDGQAKPFTLNTSVDTGHSANIFSVKFMPHSNDNTVVSCAGDSEVRVFDLEYASAHQSSSTRPSDSTRTRKFQNFFGGCKWLSHANTNARVYRSHADRAKRIVTESSPYIFLSCSEDGEVRQWDLRQPSSAYPPPRYSRNYGHRRHAAEEESEAPPALISYKHYGLDLNTISCSKSQPQYIALGGAHLHCFLHDRRMLGRNLDLERGSPSKASPMLNSHDDDVMAEATRCVRRFAPNNQRKMKAGHHVHITACKISDARPNELIASWSGDHVYSFDIVKSPDARDKETDQDRRHLQQRQNHIDRKRRRAQATYSSTSLGDGAVDGRRLRRVSDTRSNDEQAIISLTGESGTQSDSLHENTNGPTPQLQVTSGPKVFPTSERIARALVELRKTLFSFSSVPGPAERPRMSGQLTANAHFFTEALGQSCTLLAEVELVMKQWRYPNTQDEDEISLQNTLRRNRQAVWRFVQAAGVLARTLAGTLQTTSSEPDPRIATFDMIRPAPLERDLISNESRFYYDFLKAITTWLNADGALEPVRAAFTHMPDMPRDTERFPFAAENVDLSGLGLALRSYLTPLASAQKPILDIGANQFETEEYRTIYHDQATAVNTFVSALDAIAELRTDHGQSTEVPSQLNDARTRRVMDKGAAARLWGERVGRSLLMDAGHGITFDFVYRAFGGLDVHLNTHSPAPRQPLDDVDVLSSRSTTTEADTSTDTDQGQGSSSHEDGTETGDDDLILEDPEDDASESEEEESDEEDTPMFRRRRGESLRRKAFVNGDVPYSSHSKAYKGHCNTRTVKDVNYYGLDDEYVMSGSDDGHFFIWDRKTTAIVGIFEGDGEVTNVLQGAPGLPMIACSGIDSTVKIFGVGGNSRERYDARRGINIANPGGGRHSSINTLRTRHDRDVPSITRDPAEEPKALPIDDEDTVLPGGLRSRRVPPDKFYEISSQNDADRQRGMGDAFMTRGMLARLALALQNGELQGVEGVGVGPGGALVVDENCSIM